MVCDMASIQPESKKHPKYPPKMTLLSGVPKMFTIIQKGNVSTKPNPQNSHEAKNLPQTNDETETGRVIICKTVPLLNSSAQRRMAMPGINSNKIHGKKLMMLKSQVYMMTYQQMLLDSLKLFRQS